MKRAIFPGSFDPITLGHYDIIKRGVKLFDEIIVAIGVNADKKYMFSLRDHNIFCASGVLLTQQNRIFASALSSFTSDRLQTFC